MAPKRYNKNNYLFFPNCAAVIDLFTIFIYLFAIFTVFTVFIYLFAEIIYLLYLL